MRPSLMCSGSQWTARLFAIARPISFVVLMYQAGRANWMSGSFSARGQNGYSWRYVSEKRRRPRSLSSAASSLSQSFTQRPAYLPIASTKVPSVFTAQRSGSPGATARCAS